MAQERGDYDQAERAWHKAVELANDDPYVAPLLIALGQVAINRKDFDQAFVLFQRAMVDPKSEETCQAYLAYINWSMGNYPSARIWAGRISQECLDSLAEPIRQDSGFKAFLHDIESSKTQPTTSTATAPP